MMHFWNIASLLINALENLVRFVYTGLTIMHWRLSPLRNKMGALQASARVRVYLFKAEVLDTPNKQYRGAS
jgi:hypothetical protein